MQLRKWQSECVNRALKHFNSKHRHFLCLATPGAGKTIMASEVAAQLLEEDLIDFVICFSPSINISQGIKFSFSKRLNCRFDGVIGAIGCSYTYQSMLSFNEDFWQLLKRNRVLVVFDEIHHCAGSSLKDANAWGEEILLNIQNQAEYTLALTGTPWRSDKAPIALSYYTDPNNQIQCDYVYGLREAVTDGVCRNPKLVLIDNEKISVINEDNETKTFNCLDDLFKGSSISYQCIIKNGVAIRHVLKLATNKLNDIRLHNPDAAGLVVASSVEHATHILNILRQELAQTAEIVTYKEQQPSLKINEFRNSTTNWIVSVGMISEGTDIPRLQVCCHLSRVKTELYFRQVLGRVLRKNKSRNQEAWLYTFAAPKLVEFANRIAEEIPDIPVVFRQSIETEVTQGADKTLSLRSKDIPPTNMSELKLERASFDEQMPHQAELLSLDHSGPATSLSCELLGGFREKVVLTFSSPF
ncbi:DEAD/DEAH box helicase [Shewanella inventionis]|nr:DEAD/DEAH box helicase family protein [Shewanella inventionis]MCL1157583.1 DEAD/DEAH box helicase family protein [Shewanella inventionis]